MAGVDFQTTSLQRSADLRARNFSNRDNTFAGAIDLGNLGKITSTRRISARGIIGPRDRVDVFKLTIDPNLSLPGNFGSVTVVQRGELRLSTFGQVPGLGTRLLTEATFEAGTTRESGVGFDNPLDQPLTLYIKLDRPTQNTRYSFQLTYNP